MKVCTGVLQRRVEKSFQTALKVSSTPVIVLKYLPEIFFLGGGGFGWVKKFGCLKQIKHSFVVYC